MMVSSYCLQFRWVRSLITFFFVFTLVGKDIASAQESAPPPLRLDGMQPSGVRRTAAESWGAFEFHVTNITGIDRHARVVLFYDGEPDVQYGRELWVPPNSTISSWLLAGPAPPQEMHKSRDIQMLLYDLTDGQDLLMLPRTDERIRSRGVRYQKREPTTAILLDDPPMEGPSFGRLPTPDSPAVEAVRLVRTFRYAAQLSGTVISVTSSQLPPNAEAFDGIDHFVLASRRILDDPAGLRALRHWVAHGGKLWVMLDLLDLDVVAPLLGDALDFQIADRVSLTKFGIQTFAVGRESQPSMHEHEQAITFARVILPHGERPRHTIDGWPAWFIRPFGQGKIVFTALGPRGWHRPREGRDPPSPYEHYLDLPIPNPPLNRLAEELHLPSAEDPFRANSFQPILVEEIGFSVPARTTVAWVFAGFVLGALAVGLFLRRAGWPTIQGWLAPAAGLMVGIGFFAAGEWSRRGAAPTVAVAQIVEAVPGKEEAAVHGILAAYRTESGPARLGGENGGSFALDMSGMEGQARRYVQTDLESWRWDNLSLPGGMRTAPFRFTASTHEPLSVTARFGAEGIEGKLSSGPFKDVTDVLLTSPGGRNMAVRLQPDGGFRTGSAELLPPDLFLADAVLTDEQQRRQEIYREFLKRPRAEREGGLPLLLAWAKPIDTGFQLVPDSRNVGTALLVVPVNFQRLKVGSRLTIPAPLVSWQRVIPGGVGKPVLEATSEVDQLLRFQLPPEALPMKVERARLTAMVEAPSRRVTISAGSDGNVVELHHVDSPLDVVRVDITDARLLKLDELGGLLLSIRINDPPNTGGTPQKWRIDYLDLEITGSAE
jgi:hypothetical protein